jgi:hypothetical protein
VTLEEFTSRLEPGHSRGMFKCPAHDDRKASLSVADGGDKILVHCFAGCDPEAIASALDIPMREWFDHFGSSRRREEPLPNWRD